MKKNVTKTLAPIATFIGLNAFAAILPASAADYAMPYVSMGYEITNDTSGVFLTYDSQLAFPGYTLDDALQHDFFGRLAGANYSGSESAYEGGLQIGRHVQSWTNEQGKLEKVLFTVNGHKTSTHTKVVTVLLTNGVDGVYAVVPTSGACNGKVAEGTQFAEFNADGSVKYLQSSGKTLATSDTADGYGCRGLTMTRFIPSDKPVLAFKGATVDEIKGHAFTGYACGRAIANSYTSIPMTGYNAKVTKESAGVATKLRVEMQAIDGSYLTCVVVEFTSGEGGVYVKALAARYLKNGAIGYKFAKDGSGYNGESQTLARDFSNAGYGVFALKAYAPQPITTAYWTNAEGDGDITKAANWACTNAANIEVAGALPTADSTVYLTGDNIDIQITNAPIWAAVNVNGALGGNCDWLGLRDTPITDNSTIDVKGHNLTLASVFTGTITDTTTDTTKPGSLTLDVAENTTLNNTTLALSGNLRLVKEGAGAFVGGVTNQTYSGGTIVAAGVAKTGIQGTNYPFGAGSTTNPLPITIESGATFDLNGQTSHTVYRFILNGGTLTNTGADITTTGFGSLTLEADSTLAVPKTITGWSGHTIDLGGHTLTATIGDGKRLYLSGDHFEEPVTYTAGKIVVSTGGWLDFFRGKVNAKSVDFDINAALRMEVEADIHDYTARYNQNYNYGTAALNVYGTFKPMTAYWYGCTMQDGSTIDLSGRTGTWSVTSSFSDGKKTVSFSDSALVWVDLTGRTDLNGGDKIISWTTKPSAIFKVIPATTGVEVKDDGLYMAIKGGVPVADPSGKGTITIPMEWAEQYAKGETPEEQYASLTAERTEGNKIPLRDCYVLGLDPAEPTSVPFVAPVQTSNANKITLTVQGLDVKAESGALVKYQMMTKTTGSYDKSGDPVYGPTLETDLPASGVKYYRVDVIVTTPEAEKDPSARR